MTSAPLPAPGWKVAGAAAVTVVLWASAFVGIRSAGGTFAAGSLALLRLLVGSAALGVLMLVRREPLPRGRSWWPIVVAGVLWFGIYNLSLNAGERSVDAGTAALLVGVGPLLVAVLSGVFLREGFPRLLVLGLLVAFAGAAVVGLSTASAHGTSHAGLTGVLLCLVAALTSAIGIVCQKPVLARVSPLAVTFVGCVCGVLTCLPFAGSLVTDLRTASAGAVWTVVYLGVFPTAVAFTTWAFALRHTPAGRLGVTTYAVPAITVLLGWLLLAEVPPVGAVIGGVVCLVGVAVSRWRPRRRKEVENAGATADPGISGPGTPADRPG
jgi:drug/metabolite transporter (DMT)-like permease